MSRARCLAFEISHGHGHEDEHGHESEVHRISGSGGSFALSVFEDGVPPVFRITPETASSKLDASAVSVTTIRPDGTRQTFAFADLGGYLESRDDIPEPHAFKAIVRVPDGEHQIEFEEHEHGHDDAHTANRDHNIRSVYIHVIADAAVSVLAIIGLLLARAFGWVWMDPLAGVIGALVIANWSWGLMRDTGGILLDMNPDERMAENVRHVIEDNGDAVLDLHVWRVDPGHMSAIVSVATNDAQRSPNFYLAALKRFNRLSHVTVEVNPIRVVA